MAMGLVHQHRLQTALLARVCSIELAVCFVRAVSQVLRVCVRDGAIWASGDDAGRALRANFQLALETHGVPVLPALDGGPLQDFAIAEVSAAAQAATLSDCQPFLLAVLGLANARLIRELLS